jgi:hypothetical protein
MVECLLGKCEALSLNPSTTERERDRDRDREIDREKELKIMTIESHKTKNQCQESIRYHP